MLPLRHRCGAGRAAAPLQSRSRRGLRARPRPAQARDDGGGPLAGLVKSGGRAVSGVADAAINFVPASVPRPVAKAGVLGLGGLFAFSLLQKLLSAVFFFALLGGAVYLWSNVANGGDEGSGSGSRGSSSDSDGDSSDPLAEARRIMNKYK